MTSLATVPPRTPSAGWLRILVGGTAIFVLATAVMLLSRNPDLYPTVIGVGSFLVPVVFVAFLYEHQRTSSLAPDALARAFVAGGLLGILGAAALEPMILPVLFTRASGLTLEAAGVVGIIEEGSKLLALLIVARGVRRGRPLDGLLLGGAVGMGFAALESTGYAFTVLAAHGGIDGSLVEVVARALLTPFSHGIWSALAGAALFWDARSFAGWAGRAALGLATAVTLHAAWDGLRGAPVFRFPDGIGPSQPELIVAAIGAAILLVVFRLARSAQAAGSIARPAADPEIH